MASRTPDGATGTALVIGFGRFGQVASQALLARGIDVTIIDADTEMIRNATRFGFKIYYGDGTRLDVLRAAGAANAKLIAVCIDKTDTANRIVEIVNAEFPLAKLHVRSFDRGHTLDLLAAGVDYEIRETFESAMSPRRGRAALARGAPEEAGGGDVEEVRQRDHERLKLQHDRGHHRRPRPHLRVPARRRRRCRRRSARRQPLSERRRRARALPVGRTDEET